MKYLSAFRKAFKIDKKANLVDVAVAVEAVYACDDITTQFLADIEPVNNREGFRIHSLLNLMGRTFEHTQAMLVAIGTGSPASAEALARIVVEGSVNVMYLAANGDAGTLVRFYRSWLTEHDRKLTEWKQRIQAEKLITKISAMIEARRSVVHGLGHFLDQVQSQCEIDVSTPTSEWPKSLFHRFQAIGRETDYYEIYHRLSGSSHITGEDTLSWLLAMQQPELASRRKFGQEAWAYSIMMTRFASLFFIDAALVCCHSYGMVPSQEMEAHRVSLYRAIDEIASCAGVPLDAGIK
jgi:hypothetical protein